MISAPLITSGLSAQEAASSTVDEETVVELSPFTVDSSDDAGYYTNQTLAGGRLRTNLSEVATSVQVMTTEFLEDIGATGLDEALLYATNVDTEGRGSNYIDSEMASGQELTNSAARENPGGANNVRGLGRATRTVDYFQTDIAFDSYISGRLDINRGANSFLFGLGSPGGIVNSSTGQASLGRNSTKVDLRVSTENFDSNLSQRASINHNQVLLEDKLAVRVAALWADDEYTQRPSGKETNRAYASFKLKPFNNKNITLRGSYEGGEIIHSPPNRLGPLENLSTFLSDPRGIVWPKTAQNASGRMWTNGYEALRASNADASGAGYNMLGLDNDGNVIRQWGNSEGAPVGNGWTPVFDGSETADGLPTRAFVLSNRGWWSNGNPTFDPDNSFSGSRAIKFYGPPGLSDTGIFNGYSERGLLDYSVYDWRTKLISGGLDYSEQTFDRKNLTLEMLSDNGNFGLELAIDRQNFDRTSNIAIGNPRLTFDTNETLPVGPNALFGDTNPNFGRLFIYTGVTTEKVRPSQRETQRATGFAKFDFEDKFDGGILSWLGKHTLTGLWDSAESSADQVDWVMSNEGPEADFHIADTNIIGNNRRARSIIYIGPTQMDAWSNPDFTMQDFQVGDLPERLGITGTPNGHKIQVAYWNVGDPAVDANRNSVRNDEHADVTEFTYGRYVNNAKIDKTVVDSWAINLQSRLLNDHLVANFGWRGDDVSYRLNSSPPTDPVNRNKLIDPAGFNLDDVEPRTSDAQNAAYGLVLKVPKRFLPENHQVSFHYGQSSNFAAAPDGYDVDGSITPPADGDTKDYGVTYTLGNKLNVRFNMYTGSASNLGSEAGSGPSFGYGVMAAQVILRPYPKSLEELDFYDWDGDGQFDDPTLDMFVGDPNLGVAGSDGILDEFASNNPLSLSQLHAVNAAWDKLTTPFMREATRFSWMPSSAPGAEDSELSFGNDMYFILKDTVDLEAKGKELEITYNPTPNWRIAFNATEQSSKIANSFPRLGEFGERYRAALDSVPPTVLADGTVIPLDRYHHNGGLLERAPYADKYNGNAFYGKYFNNSFGGQHYLYSKAVEGQEDPKVRKYRFNFITNYTFTEGRFKGFNVGGAYRYQDAAAIGFALKQDPDTLDYYPDPTSTFNDDKNKFVDMWVGYRRRIMNDRVSWKVQLNIRNVFADNDPLVAQYQPDGSWARAKLPSPRQFILQNSFNF